jgi:hypothetical protein
VRKDYFRTKNAQRAKAHVVNVVKHYAINAVFFVLHHADGNCAARHRARLTKKKRRTTNDDGRRTTTDDRRTVVEFYVTDGHVGRLLGKLLNRSQQRAKHATLRKTT